jgi:transcriptional regulator with XRE-family HTH domain
MSTEHLPNYLRMARKRAGLSQADVAYLLGCQSGAKVSRYERFARRPTLETAIAFEVLFGTPVSDLFEGIADELRHETLKRVRRLERRLKARQSDPALVRKLATLKLLSTPEVEEAVYEPLPKR